ncbi:MAG: tRNA lysidine(34) synthetase TilS [Gammaproteobacteria bacterium]|nr:tRNA lysidine(34) synthetase TilS [Gammaproteobacteria bacterium]NNM13666.1 tRNA lysidine(34) synthetase TilS [Gammaproteobacteria bacterium]
MQCLISENLESFFGQLTDPPDKILLAYSGGLDSSVLLHALRKCCSQYNFSLSAIHVDHQLQNASTQFSDFCNDQCMAYQVPLKIKQVCIDENSGESIEAMARHARYEVFHKCIESKTYLLTAHHADDQIETFFLQLLRGAGPKGLGSMQHVQDFGAGKLARPFLHLSRQQLLAYAQQHKIEYIDDPSNLSERFDRNYLRQAILPLLQQRWPGSDQSILRSIQHIATEHKVLSEILEKKLHKLVIGNVLHINEFLQQAVELQPLLLRQWVELCGHQQPSTKILNEIQKQILNTSPESNTRISWSNVEIRAYQNKVYIMRCFPDSALQALHGQELCAGQSLVLPEKYGSLSFASNDREAPSLQVRFRVGGEKIRCKITQPSRSLKQLFNEKRVFPWMRSRIPLLFDGGDLVAVADLWVDADWLEQQKTRGFQVQWANRPAIFADQGAS